MRRILLASTAASLLAWHARGQAPDRLPPNAQPLGWPYPLTVSQATADAVSLDLNAFRAPGSVIGTTDDAPAWTAAFARMASLWTNFGVASCIIVPPPGSYINSSITPAGDGIPVCGRGLGPLPSRITLGTGFSGAVFTCDDTWQNGQTSTGSTTVGTPSAYTAGCQVENLSAIGNTGAAGAQLLVKEVDYIDFAWLNHLQCDYMTGCIRTGDYSTKNAGVFRESYIGHIKTLNTGSATQPAIDISSHCTSTGCTITGSNNLVLEDIRSYAPLGANMRLCNESSGAMHKISGWGITLEQDATATNGDQLDFGGGSSVCNGTIQDVDLALTISNPVTGHAGILFNNQNCSASGTSNTAPTRIRIRAKFTHASGFNGANVDAECGNDIKVEATTSGGAGTLWIVGSSSGTTAGLTGPFELDAGLTIASQSRTVNTAAQTAGYVNFRNDPTYGQLVGGTLNLGGTTYTALGASCTLFTSSGTWTKLSSSNVVEAFAVGSGGGGGGGETAAVAGSGGGGGGGGAFEIMPPTPASLLTGTVTVTIAAAGTSGAAQTAGGNGGASLFGTYLQAGGGGGGGPGGTAATSGGGGGGGVIGANGSAGTTSGGSSGTGGSAGGTGVASSATTGVVGPGSGGAGTGATGVATQSGQSAQGATGGGSGGGNTAGAGVNGAASGATWGKGATAGSAGTGGASCTPGGAGNPPNVWPSNAAASGGGGGGGITTGTGCVGGQGGLPGGGGGGGGAGSVAGGAGGAGGAGEVEVCQW